MGIQNLFTNRCVASVPSETKRGTAAEQIRRMGQEVRATSIFAQVIKKRREHLNFTQKDLADRCAGLTRETLANWESGRLSKRITAERRHSLALALEMAPAELDFAYQQSLMLAERLKARDQENDLAVLKAQLSLILSANGLVPETRGEELAFQTLESSLETLYRTHKLRDRTEGFDVAECCEQELAGR